MKHKLNAKAVENAKPASAGGKEFLNDGGGLYLQTRKSGSKSWQFRWRDKSSGKLKAMGLGGFPGVKLGEARDKADSARKVVAAGGNPQLERDAALKLVQAETQEAEQEAEAKATTFKRAAEDYITAMIEPVRTAKQANQWRASLRDHAYPTIGSKPLDTITVADMVALLKPIWKLKEDGGRLETASRVQQRASTIFDWAAHKGLCSNNPARWKGCLSYELPSAEDVRKAGGGRKGFKWMPYQKVGEFMEKLRESHPGNASACLQFTILTGCRSGESRGARWEEIDFKANSWLVPASRTKRRVPHRKPLSPAAIKVLKAQEGKDPELVFPSPRDKVLSDMALSMLMRRAGETDSVPHGFRSSFRTWASECTSYPRDLCEMVLHHRVKTEVEAAYDKSDQFEKRRKLMNDWAKYLCS